MSKFLSLRKFKKNFHSNSNFHLNSHILATKNLKSHFFLFLPPFRPKEPNSRFLYFILFPYQQPAHSAIQVQHLSVLWPILAHGVSFHLQQKEHSRHHRRCPDVTAAMGASGHLSLLGITASRPPHPFPPLNDVDASLPLQNRRE
jgi:hypothetical protein